MNKTADLNRADKYDDLIQRFREGIISADDLSEELNDMVSRNEILRKQAEFCGFWQASDGRWKTKVPDENAPEKDHLLARKRREDLEDAVIQWYREGKGKYSPACLNSIFPKWIVSKERETSVANANKLTNVWVRYYAHEPITEVPFEDLSTGRIKDWMLESIERHRMTKRQFKEMKSVINMMYDYAISYNYTTINLARQVRGFSDRIFREEDLKPVEEIIYTDDTRAEVLTEAMNQYEKTGNTAYLAVCLNFSLGLRVGELVALRLSCIDDDQGIIQICREEVKTYCKDKNGHIHRSGYEVVNHTKTASGIRSLVLTPSARKYIAMAIQKNKERDVSDEDYIFVDKNGDRIHDYAVNNVLRRLNGYRPDRNSPFIINGKPSGNHAIRKTCISELHESLRLSDETPDIRTYQQRDRVMSSRRSPLRPMRKNLQKYLIDSISVTRV